MQSPPTNATTHFDYALVCLFAIPDVYLLLFTRHLQQLLIRKNIRFSDPKAAAAFLRSDRFLYWVRGLAAATLVLYGFALYLIHLRLPSYPRYH